MAQSNGREGIRIRKVSQYTATDCEISNSELYNTSNILCASQNKQIPKHSCKYNTHCKSKKNLNIGCKIIKQISDRTKMDKMFMDTFLVEPRMGYAKNTTIWDTT